MARIPDPPSAGDVQTVTALAGAVRRGTLAVITAQVMTQLISVVVLAILYRRVGPEPFGLLGMAIPLIFLLRIFSSLGLNIATIQRSEISASELNSLFWMQQICGALTTALIALCGPLLAWIYGVPQLTLLVAVLSATSLLVSLGAQHQALMERHLRLARLALARLVALLLGGLAGIWAAYADLGVWALVVQQYVELALLVILGWMMEPWRPHLRFSIGPLRNMIAFGSYWTLSSLVLSLGQTMDKFLLAFHVGGSPEGLAAIGMYTQAFHLTMKPVHIVTTPVTGIMLPALARAAGNGHLYQSLLSTFYRMVATLLFPCGVGLMAVANDLMLVLGGQAWRPAGLIVTLLAPAILVQGFVNILASVFASVGRSDRLFRAALAVTSLLCLGYAVGIQLGAVWGPAGLGPACGLAVTYSALLLGFIVYPYTAYAWRTAAVDQRLLWVSLKRPFIAACIMGIVVVIARVCLISMTSCPETLRFVLMIVTGVVVYSILARSELAWFSEQLLSARS